VTSLCRELGVSTSGYYAWCNRPLPRREQRNDQLVERIKQVHTRSHGTYGSPRVHKALVRQGVRCGLHRVARLMRRDGIVAIGEQRYPHKSTTHQALPVSPDRLRRDFTAAEPNQVWVSDMTFLGTGQGWLHLCAIIDLYSRRCVGWATGPGPNHRLAVAALQSAIHQRRPRPGLIFHTDQGGAYRSFQVQELLNDHGILGSTSRPGNCLDNAVAESFFKTLKTEMYYHRHFANRELARRAVFEFIEAFYNPVRLHSTLDYQSPNEFETTNQAA